MSSGIHSYTPTKATVLSVQDQLDVLLTSVQNAKPTHMIEVGETHIFVLDLLLGAGNFGKVFATKILLNDGVTLFGVLKYLTSGTDLDEVRSELEHILSLQAVGGIIRATSNVIYQVDGSEDYFFLLHPVGIDFEKLAPSLTSSDLQALTPCMLHLLNDVAAMLMIHHDIKPPNLLYGVDRSIRFIDWGLGGKVESGRPSDPGTQIYLLTGTKLTSSVKDVYAAGNTLRYLALFAFCPDRRARLQQLAVAKRSEGNSARKEFKAIWNACDPVIRSAMGDSWMELVDAMAFDTPNPQFTAMQLLAKYYPSAAPKPAAVTKVLPSPSPFK